MKDERYSRQSFLGKNSQAIIESAVVGIVGLGGGGTHIIQQLAHIGFQNYIIIDPQKIDGSNLNRMVGAKQADVENKLAKTEIAERVIKDLQPNANIKSFISKWQDNVGSLKKCDILFGCVDSFKERHELEIFSRRFLIPYIDIGMDVFKVKSEPFRMVGQIILSMPGDLCMHCLGFLDSEKLTREANKYGKAGGRPQVVWSNGILASTAVGIAVNLLTGWSDFRKTLVYLSYDGNSLKLENHKRLDYLDSLVCSHFPKAQVGDPIFKSV